MLCNSQLSLVRSLHSQEMIPFSTGYLLSEGCHCLPVSLEMTTFQLKLLTLRYVHGISCFSRKTRKCSLNLLFILQSYKTTSFLSVNTRKDLKTCLYWIHFSLLH